MSPEQIEGREIDSRSDVYSLGITAYHMLTGEPPFGGDSPLAVAVQHLNQAPPSLNGQSNVPTSLAAVIDRMIAKKPADRFRDPSALLDALNQALRAGLDEGWATGTAQTSLATILQATDERVVVTSRLDELMKTTANTRPTRAPVARIAAALLGCALLGAGGAAWLRSDSLLASAQRGPERSSDVWGQLYQAKLLDTEQAWQAVAQNFPNADKYSHNLARQGLVYFYLTRTQDFEKALEESEVLAAAVEPDFRAFGIAGMVVAYVYIGDDEQAMYENQRLDASMRDVLEEQSPRMARLLNQALDDLADRAL
jgi:serine/threonine-protein kinase